MEKKKNNGIALSTAYLPNLQYFSKFLHGRVTLEQHENYHKQTFRNRCEILSANGIMPLTIPVEHSAPKIPVRDVRIDYSTNWQKIHWKTLIAAYRSSAFFEYYIDDFIPFYEKHEIFLFDFNIKLIYKLLELTGLKAETVLSDSYIDEYELDYRTSISPKKKQPDSSFVPTPYYQVFEKKFGFCSNLSVIDLLCNEGNNSCDILKRSIIF
jgi:hypothetical protein